jgi:hypothetical protein
MGWRGDLRWRHWKIWYLVGTHFLVADSHLRAISSQGTRVEGVAPTGLFYVCINLIHDPISYQRSRFKILPHSGLSSNIQNFLFSFIVFTFTYTYIHYLDHLSPSLQPSGRTGSALLFSNFVEENAYKIKRKTVFLLVWDEDSYTGRFRVLFPCIYVLQPKLVHLYQTPSLFPSHLPIVASVSLRLLYLLLHNYIQGFGFIPFSYPFHAQSSLSV